MSLYLRSHLSLAPIVTTDKVGRFEHLRNCQPNERWAHYTIYKNLCKRKVAERVGSEKRHAVGCP